MIDVMRSILKEFAERTRAKRRHRASFDDQVATNAKRATRCSRQRKTSNAVLATKCAGDEM